MPRYVRAIAEFFAALVGLAVILIALVAWRLSDSPINSTFLTPYIESGIERYIPSAQVQIAHTLLTWDNVDRSIALHADNVVIKNNKDKTIAEVPSLDLRLSLIGLIVGQFWPVEMTIDHPQIKLDRHADGRVFFADMSASTDDSSTETDTRAILKQALSNLTHAYAMRHVVVARAAIEIHDEPTGKSWSVGVPEISLQHTLTQLNGVAKIELTQNEKPETLELRYAYDRIKSLHRISTRFSDITPAQLVGGHPETLGLDAASIFDLPLSGEVELAFDPDLDVAAAAMNLHGGQGALHAQQLWDKPRSVKSFDIEGDFDRQAHKLNLATAAVDFDGPKLNMTASGHKPADATKYDVDFTATAKIENWPMESLNDLWPKSFALDARDWVVPNLRKGIYDKGEATLTGSFAFKDLANLAVASGEGKLSASHGSVNYIDGMPPVEDVSTNATFDLKQMKIDITGGGIGNLHLQPFTITITGLSDEDQYIDIPMAVTGPIPEIVKLIDYPPLRYATAVGLTPDSLSGDAQGVVSLKFPLLKTLTTNDIAVTATAKLSKVASSRLVKGIDITQGDLGFELNNDNFTAKGPLVLNKIPLQLAFQQYFHAVKDKPLRQIDLSGNIADEIWKNFGDDFAGTRGSVAVALKITQADKDTSTFVGTADLAAVDLRFATLNWKKPAGVAAILHFSGEKTDGKDFIVKSISLNGPRAYAVGKAVVDIDGVVKTASFAPLALGRTSAGIAFSQSTGENGALRFEAVGKSLDVSGIKGGKDPARADPRPKQYHLKVDKLYTSDTGIIAAVEADAVRDPLGWSSISIHGLADGDHKLDIDLTPKPDGTRTLAIACDDFGKMMKGLGFTDTIQEGKVKIEGASAKDNPRIIDGTVKISSFSVGNLPVLALLLNATSPFGFVGLVTNRVSFEHMNGAFRWSDDEINLKHINAAGTSVGLNIDGKIDIDSGVANLNGTLVPFSMVNRFLGALPLIGDILTGGDGGGVLAVAYDVKGPLADPKVSVNPVSLLTPGFLRNLFFNEDNSEETAK